MDAGLPPGPKLPIVVQTVLGYRYPYWFLAACQRRYGDIFTVRAIPWGTVVYLTDPVDIRATFAGDGDIFHAGAARAPLGAVVGDRSVLVLDGEAHQQCRRPMTPAFTGEAVRGWSEEMVSVAGQFIAGWPLDRPVALHPRIKAIFFEMLLRVMIGTGDPVRFAELRAALPPLVSLRRAVPFMLAQAVQERHPVLARYGPGRRYARMLARANELLNAEIARARTDPELDSRTDLLAVLVRARDAGDTPLDTGQVRDQLITLLLAGQEPTASAVAWAIERLIRHPETLARARRAAMDDDERYLDAIILEALRMRPIADPTRQLTRPVQVAGYQLPAGALVIPAIGWVQRSARHFADPQEFRPERFLGIPAGSDSWLTFGGGPRRCLGASFAPMGMRTVLREVLRRVDLEPTNASAEPVRVENMISVPGRGTQVTLRSATG